MKGTRLLDKDSFVNKWLFQYKLYHLLFWFAYHSTFWILTTGSIQNLFSSPYAGKFVFYVILQALAAYFNLYFLMPRFLEKGKYGQYLLLFFATITVTALLILPGYYLSAWLAGKPFKEVFQRDPSDFFYFFKTYTLPSTLGSSTLAMSIKLAKNWLQTKQREQELEKEKLDTELKFLKSQMNPHFLFNTINSIFVLIHKNPNMASESLAKFSDLLRYQLYECNEHQIRLGRELAYVENFIELQELRQDSDYIDVKINIEQYTGGELTIAPFVLLPFVENAFKHVSRHKGMGNWIHLDLNVVKNTLQVHIANSVSATETQHAEIINCGGIGLANIKRRLDLVYPRKHKLSIHQDGEKYSVNLELVLEEVKVREHISVPA